MTCDYNGDYSCNQCYLNWEGTWLNTRPKWIGNHIDGMFISKEPKPSAKSEEGFSINELGLFDGDIPNDNIRLLFNKYEYMILQKNGLVDMKNYITLLKNNKNMVLTGAPGTDRKSFV